ncbi:DUF6474 family protein [Pseudonocardia nigra]|uniref:DUF6474 family protein n=1 Tax=Pseudonocardia nigra TaxID=1921578 RepID=UPI001C5DB3B1|nr:DUF6474 family protein [Pseudonocardia nigra]
MGLRRRSGRVDADAAVEPPGDVTAVVGEVTRRAGEATRKAGARAEHAGADLTRPVRRPLTASRAKRLIGVGKAVAPLLAPYALAAAGVLRSRWDNHRAARLGVDPGQLAAYAGPGGALHARLSRVAEALNEIEAAGEAHGTDAGRAFAADIRPRLADLAVGVRAAEQMPAQRRRAAYRAISGELDRIETELLRHLDITP